jgi:phosphoglycerate dehydrogenase-like enzyme
MELLLPGELRGELEAPVRMIVPDVVLRWYSADCTVDGRLDAVEGLFRWSIPNDQLRAFLAATPRLRWLHVARAGVDGPLLEMVRDRPVLLSNSAGMHAVPIGEYVLWAMLAHAKQARRFYEQQRRQLWADDELGFPLLGELAGKTLLIIGLGRIGVGIAQRAQAFGMRVIGSNRSGRPQPHVDAVVADPGWRALLPQADYVVLAAPLTAATRGMFGADELAQLPAHAYLINIARGEIVDEAALIAALRSGRIAGAALDVFAEEPLPAEHELWALPNVTITPHMSWSSPQIRTRSLQYFLDNLTAFAAGQRLPNLVDKEAGY